MYLDTIIVASVTVVFATLAFGGAIAAFIIESAGEEQHN